MDIEVHNSLIKDCINGKLGISENIRENRDCVVLVMSSIYECQRTSQEFAPEILNLYFENIKTFMDSSYCDQQAKAQLNKEFANLLRKYNCKKYDKYIRDNELANPPQKDIYVDGITNEEMLKIIDDSFEKVDFESFLNYKDSFDESISYQFTKKTSINKIVVIGMLVVTLVILAVLVAFFYYKFSSGADLFEMIKEMIHKFY